MKNPEKSHCRPQRDWRYERKFVITPWNPHCIDSALGILPGAFSEEFPERWVNSIYFDDLEFSSLAGNISGISTRKKYRLRWYGSDNLGPNSRAQFEIKSRDGNVGKKQIFQVQILREIGSMSQMYRVTRIARDMTIDTAIAALLSTLHPTVFVRYERKYYRSEILSCRATLDSSILYRALSGFGTSVCKCVLDPRSILEIKHGVDSDVALASILSKLDLRLSRNSKYVTALLSLSGVGGYCI